MNKIVIDGKEIELSDDMLNVVYYALHKNPLFQDYIVVKDAKSSKLIQDMKLIHTCIRKHFDEKA